MPEVDFNLIQAKLDNFTSQVNDLEDRITTSAQHIEDWTASTVTLLQYETNMCCGDEESPEPPQGG